MAYFGYDIALAARLVGRMHLLVRAEQVPFFLFWMLRKNHLFVDGYPLSDLYLGVGTPLTTKALARQGLARAAVYFLDVASNQLVVAGLTL